MILASQPTAPAQDIGTQASSIQVAENLAQQVEEVLGLQAICGNDCISTVNQAGDHAASSTAGQPGYQHRLQDGQELLEADLQIHVELPGGHLKLTVRQSHARQSRPLRQFATRGITYFLNIVAQLCKHL